MVFTRRLEDAIRRAEIAGIRSGIEAANRLDPGVGATGIEIAGGLAAFTGIGSPLSQAYGVGTLAPVSAREIDEITGFYRSRSAVPRIFVTPAADPSLGLRLAAAGYAPSESESLLASDDLTQASRDDRVCEALDVHEWAQASARAFLEPERNEPPDERIALLLAASEGTSALELREDGVIAATAAMDVRYGCAALFAGSTLPRFRNRGFHLALIRDRIARARDAGASLLRASAKPASLSERNFHRCGFVTLCTRVLWELVSG